MPKIAHIGSILSNKSTITGPGCPTVRVNGQIVSVAGDSVSDRHNMVGGSPNVRAGGKPIIRLGDKDSRGYSVVSNVSPNVSANG